MTAPVDRKLLNLLARVHGDGGHHTETVGLEQSDLDAHRVVARLRADVEQLKYERDYTPPTGAVSEGLRACVKAAGQACLDGEADCPKAGCVVGHRAGEILDAYDDAAAEVERLTKRVLTIGEDAARLRERVAVVEGERNVVRRMYVESGFTRKETQREKSSDFATRLGWTDLYLDGSPTGATSSEPGNADEVAPGAALDEEPEGV